MSDAARDGYADDDRLPWLEAVEEEEQGPSLVKLLAGLLLGIILIGVVVGGLYWLGTRGASGGGGGELITSPGEYKVRPDTPGGMQLSNQASTQVATSEGTEQQASLNRSAAPETPVTRPTPPATAPAAPPAAQAPARPAPAQSQPQAQRPTGPTIQVGAYPSQAAAASEWTRLSQAYPYLSGLQQRVEQHQRAGQTFYRLRASGAEASAVCRRLRAARQPCMDVS